MAILAAEKGIKNIFLPASNAQEAALIENENFKIYPLDSLNSLISHLIGQKIIKPFVGENINVLETTELCPHCNEVKGTCNHEEGWGCRFKAALKYAFIDMPRELGLEIMIGILLAAFVASSLPVGHFIGKYLSGLAGYAFSLIFGILMYICSTATVPLADAFIKQGMNVGAAMVLMLVGPITSYGTILVLRKEFGSKILFIYLSLVSIISLLCGFLYALIA